MFSILSRLLLLLLPVAVLAAVDVGKQPSGTVYRQWIAQMKQAPRGPFSRIRWFCKDGEVLPPRPYACREHGGGSQHGEWNERARELRRQGYLIANVLSDLPEAYLRQQPEDSDRLNQILIEQFLIATDNGWILRKARYYRGALQAEGELRGARRLLIALLGDRRWRTRGYTPIRLAARLLPHGRENRSVTEIRELSADLSRRDPSFMPLRNKIHVRPQAADAEMVSDYLEQVHDPRLRADYERLVALIDEVYRPADLSQELRHLASRRAVPPRLARALEAAAEKLGTDTDAGTRFSLTASLMAAIRDDLPGFGGPVYSLDALDLSLALEKEHYVAASTLRGRLAVASRRQRLAWLRSATEAIYGAGLISARERAALRQGFARLDPAQVSVADYKQVLDDLARAPGWGSQQLRFHFFRSMRKLAELEPRAALFIQDQLRGSPLFFYSELLDGLLRDANRLSGVRNTLFGEDVGAGLRALNPGLASGVLRLPAVIGKRSGFDAGGIYLLPETVSDLPPVAGILTAGAGNPLSHIQLLARNLGIPNVAVDESLIPRLRPHQGERVILAVSPAGMVQLKADDGSLAQQPEPEHAEQVLIRPDLDKLDLTRKALLPLSELRASDSGRTVGPKAAKLGELYHHFPEAVAPGLAIPFGRFRELLEQPHAAGGQSVYAWMLENYARLAAMTAGTDPRRQATEAFRKQLQDWILHADPGQTFRDELRAAMADAFGEDGSYGVFVRSDTNVEDLPGFTGAGLNLTVPNVVGFDQVMAAIARVWASPFSARAFAWRQSRMEQPQHVYPAVLLLRSVASEKSGVMVTQDIDTGDRHWVSVAVNQGVGGAVDGQAAESLRINLDSGEVRLLAQATAPLKRVLDPRGGLDKVPVGDGDTVLGPGEIKRLIRFARELPQRFPPIVDAAGQPAPADVEFGFVGGELRLFQLRPFLESRAARGNAYLQAMDAGMRSRQQQGQVDLEQTPEVGQ